VNLYWYAPFNNAHERGIAAALGEAGEDITVQTLASRRGVPTTRGDDPVRLIADLRDTPGDDGGRRTWLRRTSTTVERVRRRHRAVRQERFDILHIHTYNPFADPVALRLLPRHSRVILSIHNVRPHDRKVPIDALERRLLRSGYVVPELLIVAHPQLREQLVRECGIDPGRIAIVPLAIPTVDPPPPPPGDRASYLFFGTLRRNKGIDVTIEAMRRVADPSIRLHFAGRGDADLERSVWLAAAADPRITAEIGYIEPSRQAELLRGSSTLLLPYTELAAQSGVLQDACAYRRPVIATKVGALGAQVSESDIGIVVEPNDPDQLAAAMVALAADDDRWLRHHHAADRLARERSIPAIAEMFRLLYQRELPDR
jgi:glycosyltransferase involved in cell wall biosynthesis